MNLIRKINDSEFLKTYVLSKKEPRITARGILLNHNDQILLMYSEKFNLYSFPGGGVEDKETPQEAVLREIYEETGYKCIILKALGYIEENRGQLDYTQISYYYILCSIGSPDNQQLTADEITNRTIYRWYKKEDIEDILLKSSQDTLQQKYLKVRDLYAWKEYVEKNY